MIYLMMAFVLFLLLILSFFLAEIAYSPINRSAKTRLLDSLRRISLAQQNLHGVRQCGLLFFSVVCCVFSIGVYMPYMTLFLPPYFHQSEAAALVKSHYAPLIYLGLLTLLQVAGEISQALTERRNSSAALVLNSYFWLPLLIAWASLAAYLPFDPSHITKESGSSMWLGILQPTGCLAFALALIGPYLLINARALSPASPIHNWIRELRMVVGLSIIIPLIYGRTCFSHVNEYFSPAEIAGIAAQVILLLVLMVIVLKLKKLLRKQVDLNPERLWKITLWLSMISVTSSFVAFHVLGTSDPLMHVLLNFSLLAIWIGFIAPKANLKLTKNLKTNSSIPS